MKTYYGKSFIAENHLGTYSGEKYARVEVAIENENTSSINYYADTHISHHIVDEYIQPVKLLDGSLNLAGIDLVTIPKQVVRSEVNIRKGTVKVSTVFHGKKFEGIAKCHEDDVFDAGIGFQIALSRMEIEIQKFKMQRVMNLVGGRE